MKRNIGCVALFLLCMVGPRTAALLFASGGNGSCCYPDTLCDGCQDKDCGRIDVGINGTPNCKNAPENPDAQCSTFWDVCWSTTGVVAARVNCFGNICAIYFNGTSISKLQCDTVGVYCD